MKILAITQLYPNKIYPNWGIFVSKRLQEVAKHHDVIVISPIPWFPFCSYFKRYKNYNLIPREDKINGIKIHYPRFLIIPKFFSSATVISFYCAVRSVVRKIEESFDYDIIDLHWTFPELPVGVWLARKTNKKLIVTVRGKEAFYFGGGCLRGHIIRKFLVQADYVINLSNQLKQFSHDIGVSEKNNVVIRNGVDHTVFYYLPIERCRERLNIPRNERIILTVGWLNFGKGFDRIIEALPDLSSEKKETHLYIIGSEGPTGFYYKELRMLCEKMGVADKVHFIGTVDNENLYYWYNAADVFCLSSRSEGSPNVVMEALSCGCPVVATDVGSVTEIITSDYMGKVVANSREGVADGLRSLDYTLIDRCRIAGDMKTYSWAWCAAQVNSIYKKVLL